MSVRTHTGALTAAVFVITAFAFALIFTAHAEFTHSPSTERHPNPTTVTQEDGTFLEEDEAGWNCKTMGNKKCG